MRGGSGVLGCWCLVMDLGKISTMLLWKANMEKGRGRARCEDIFRWMANLGRICMSGRSYANAFVSTEDDTTGRKTTRGAGLILLEGCLDGEL